MKTRNAKKTSTVIITLIVTVILVTAIIITIMMLMKKPKQEQLGNQGNGTTGQVASTGNFHENGWDASIVAEIKDGVPVPMGFQYVSGDKKSGLIVQNSENGKTYVWIPYSDTSMNDEEKQKVIDEYFKDKEGTYINPDKLAEIQKYGGFYAGIDYLGATVIDPEEEKIVENENKTYSIARMKQNEYNQAEDQVAQENVKETAVNGSIMGKEELSMMLDFSQSNAENPDKVQISTSLISAPITNLEQVQSASTDLAKQLIGRTFYVKEGGATGYGATMQLTATRPTNGSPIRTYSLEAGAPVVIQNFYPIHTVGPNLNQLYAYVTVEYYTGEWYNVYLADLSPQKTSAGPNVFYPGGQVKYTNKKTTMYSEPQAIAGKEVKSLEIGDTVRMYKATVITNNLWYYVKSGDKWGYVFSGDVTTTKIWESITGDQTRFVLTSTSLYSRPELVASSTIKALTRGTKLTASKKATIDGKTWAYVKVGGQSGYVLAEKLGTTNPNGGNNNTPSNPNPPASSNPTTNTTPATNTTPETPTTPEEPEEEKPVTVPAYTGEVITVKPGETKQIETPVPDKWKNTVATIINGVPVPKGFEVATYYGPADENTGFVIRQISSKEAENFHRLCYVWVPVNKNGNTIESLEDAKRALNEAYTKAGLNTKTSESAVESLPSDLVKSVKEYGGFYIAMGELGYDNNGKFYNRPRGMKESDTHKGWYGVDYGNYFRYVPEDLWNQTTPVNYIAAAATYDNIMKDCSLEKINKVCEMLSTESVTSHLTYGAEWDAAMLWILKRDASTAEDLTSLLLKDSSSIGKYSGTMFNAKMLNCTWGFAGNLAEVTQEKVDGKIVVRGGSYATLGSEQPIASRTAVEETEIRKGNQYGFRNCIYINLTGETAEPASELQALIDSGKATTERITTVTDQEGNKISIPQGFKVTKDAYHINEGVVIENAQGDQFVWVPVANINEMYNANEQSGKLYNITKDGSNLKVITSINDKYFEPGIVTGGTGKDIDANAENLKILELDHESKLERQMKNEFNAMINSVNTYGGFYIARYETGNIDQEYPSVKQSTQNRTNLNWYQAYVKNQKIPTGNYGISGTIYGCQWDMALRWLQSCDASNKKVNHIEDLANGTAEWTMEAFANDARIVRDVAREESTVVQAGTRMDYNPTQVATQIGTRAMMYIR